jgi:hypothetical protein
VDFSPGTSITGDPKFDGGEDVSDSDGFVASVLVAYAGAMKVGENEEALDIEIGGKTFTPEPTRKVPIARLIFPMELWSLCIVKMIRTPSFSS